MFFVTSTILMTAISDWLFFMHPVGWNVGIWHFMLLSAVILTHPGKLRLPEGRLLLLICLALVGAAIAQPGPLVFLCSVLSLLSFALLRDSDQTASDWFRCWLIFALTGWLRLLQDLRIVRRWRSNGHRFPLFPLLARSMLDWFLPVVLTLLFLALFTAANPVIDSTISHMKRTAVFLLGQIYLDPFRIFFWVVCFGWGWALLRKRISPGTPQRTVPVKEERDHTRLIVRCLFLFNTLFLLQNMLDIRYLWAGGALPDGMGYAEYAHRGAYPLIATTLLAGAFVLITFRPGNRTGHHDTARRLVMLWLCQNVFLTVSALWRLHLYVQVYGLTRWRMAAGIWMTLIAAGLLWTALRIQTERTNDWLLNTNFYTTVLVLFASCFVNFNGWIAWHNVQHCREVTGTGVHIDLDYMSGLGPESLPALEWLRRQPGAAPIADQVSHRAQNLREQLQRQVSDWRGWTLRNKMLLKESAAAAGSKPLQGTRWKPSS